MLFNVCDLFRLKYLPECVCVCVSIPVVLDVQNVILLKIFSELLEKVSGFIGWCNSIRFGLVLLVLNLIKCYSKLIELNELDNNAAA